MEEPTGGTHPPSIVAAALTTVRLIGGWACAGVGVLNLSMGIDTRPGSTDGRYLLFHVVMLATGLILLDFGMLRRRPGPSAFLVGAVVAAAGLLISTLPRTTTVCCEWAYPDRHGYPLTLLAGGAGAWHFDLGRAVADLAFWCCIGFLATVLTGIVRPARAVVEPPPSTRSTHAEDRATAPPTAETTAESTAETTGETTVRNTGPRDENVGGLP